ncbi:hypothetical protein EVA_17301 [gut metagenome]|uniref:Uncharacterized protein n=1 Tax=gut metagenome TaxID=749906 RepID=J9FJL2_9ZZZZ
MKPSVLFSRPFTSPSAAQTRISTTTLILKTHTAGKGAEHYYYGYRVFFLAIPLAIS